MTRRPRGTGDLEKTNGRSAHVLLKFSLHMVNYAFDVLNYASTNHQSLQLRPPQVHDSQAERNEPMSYVDAAALVTSCKSNTRADCIHCRKWAEAM